MIHSIAVKLLTLTRGEEKINKILMTSRSSSYAYVNIKIKSLVRSEWHENCKIFVGDDTVPKETHQDRVRVHS